MQETKLPGENSASSSSLSLLIEESAFGYLCKCNNHPTISGFHVPSSMSNDGGSQSYENTKIITEKYNATTMWRKISKYVHTSCIHVNKTTITHTCHKHNLRLTLIIFDFVSRFRNRSRMQFFGRERSRKCVDVGQQPPS